jgi:phosphoribosyl 1,2-cyclic phosphodiesterase
MALAYCTLASGSSGNCLWIRGGGTEVLIDCGISCRQIEGRLAAIGSRIEQIEAVICTHGHDDHVAAAPRLICKHGLPIWATEGTRAMLHIAGSAFAILPLEGRITIQGLELKTIPTSHDAPGSVALIISDGDSSLAVVTDLGVPSPTIIRALREVEGLVLESNHDEQMLRDGPYPEWLKRRIRGKHGHLSNAQAARLAGESTHRGLQHLTLAHLSEHNNTPALARQRMEAALEESGASCSLAIAPRHSPGELVSLKPRRGQLVLPLRATR